MGSFPLGGITIDNVDFGSVELFDVTYSDPEVYTPSASNAVDPAGLILARVTASSKLVPYVVAGSGGTEIPVAILGSDVNADATPNDVNLTVIVSGQVRLPKLTILAGGTVDKIEIDKLQQVGILAKSTTQLNQFDNPQ